MPSWHRCGRWGFQCFGLQTAALEAALLLLKPSESPKEDSQALAQAVTIVIRAGEPAPEPRRPLCPQKVLPGGGCACLSHASVPGCSRPAHS